MSGERSRQQYLTLRARVELWVRTTRAELAHHAEWEGQPAEVRTTTGSWVDVTDLLDQLEASLDAQH